MEIKVNLRDGNEVWLPRSSPPRPAMHRRMEEVSTTPAPSAVTGLRLAQFTASLPEMGQVR